jgi:spore photoproduct lyase
MFETIYIENGVKDHPRVKSILTKLNPQRLIYIERYGEIFNRKGQNFRTQKKEPSLILAYKNGKKIHAIPSSYGIGHEHNYYFSHLYNCPFDCSYCYLQGMFRSAHYVLFVNYEDFTDEILAANHPNQTCFFSGYDADSLALESVSGFLSYFLDFFQKKSSSFLEIRTKSTALLPLLQTPSFPRAIVAYTISPKEIIQEFEPKTPTLKARITAIQKLQKQGWPVGLRFDPVIGITDALPIYRHFFSTLFNQIDSDGIHSATLGLFRLPKSYFQNMVKIDAATNLLPLLQQDHSGQMTTDYQEQLKSSLYAELLKYLPKHKVHLI